MIPPQANAEFVWRMEDVLEVYTRPYDPRFPQVCLDETSAQLLTHSRPPLPMQPGVNLGDDSEAGRAAKVAFEADRLRDWFGG